MLTLRRNRWLISTLLFVQASALPLSAFASAFADVEDTHPYAASIEQLRKLEIIHGFERPGDYPVFWPDQSITRAEFVAMVVRTIAPQTLINGCLADEQLLGATGLPFRDVTIDDWFAPSLCVAWAQGLVSGFPDATFRPENAIRFSEAAKILSVAFQLTDKSLPDLDVLGKEWYLRYIHFLDSASAIPPSIQGPNRNITRGETAEMIARLIGGGAPPSVTRSLSEAEVLHPVRWMTEDRSDLGIHFSYPDSWPTPYELDRGTNERLRLPKYQSRWTMTFGPRRTCLGNSLCTERDFSLSGYAPTQIPATLEDITHTMTVHIVSDETTDTVRTIVFDEDLSVCRVRSALFITKERMIRFALHCGSTLEDPTKAFMQLLERMKVDA